MQRTLKFLAAATILFLSSHAAASFDSATPTLPAGYAGDDIKKWYGEISASAPVAASIKDEVFAFAVDLDAGPNFSQEYDAASGKMELHYNMVFNQIAEGWSWDELANPDQHDYYHFKFLPLGFETASKRAPEVVELYPGKTLEVKNLWRYEYFFSFENLYDFYERKVDDDAGFDAAVVIKAEEAGLLLEGKSIHMLALCRLKPPYHTESNTFWKATFAEPVDYTLRKRYLVGELLEVWFYDSASGKVLAKVRQR
ncbi:MAG: hypothetical protein KJ958_12150 [Gammaproteobacteria bacterium]|nr:hypothetical protein [Gammaproteobacteria bacterium]MBU1979908.1 hypothetical protein [Gammaproteobacteria bacterium]